jgi:hypothetical protein
MSSTLPAPTDIYIFLFNVSNIRTADMVRRFRVDGIPHLAFIGGNQEVKTALVGSIPKTVLKDEIVALLQVLHSAFIRLCCLRKSLF